MRPTITRRDPDARGYFGEFGGRFVPETLVEPIEALERAYLEVRDDPAFRARLDSLLAHYVGRPTPIYEATAVVGRVRWQPDLPQARGPHPYGRTQNQQRSRAGPSRRENGEASHRCRDRRRTAWRRDSHRLRASRSRMPRLHGVGGYAAAGPQRLPHAIARSPGLSASTPAAGR